MCSVLSQKTLDGGQPAVWQEASESHSRKSRTDRNTLCGREFTETEF